MANPFTVDIDAPVARMRALVPTAEPGALNREEWLQRSTLALGEWFADADTDAVIPEVQVSVGFPRGGGRKRIGECWDPSAATDNVAHVFISPTLDDPQEILAVLAHELVHATVGTDKGHGKVFGRLAGRIGLIPPWRQSTPSDRLRAFSQAIVDHIGPWPSGRLDPQDRQRKQGTRMVKLECEECGYTVRTTRRWIETGLPLCGNSECEGCGTQPLYPVEKGAGPDRKRETGEPWGEFEVWGRKPAPDPENSTTH